MSAPRLGQGMPTDDSWVARQLADLQRQITELRASGATGFAQNFADGVGFFTSTSFATIATTSVTVPGGFTQAIIIANALIGCLNNTGSSDYMQIYCAVNGANTIFPLGTASAGGFISLEATELVTLTGLTSGQTITVTANVKTGAAPWNGVGGNAGQAKLVAIFLR